MEGFESVVESLDKNAGFHDMNIALQNKVTASEIVNDGLASRHVSLVYQYCSVDAEISTQMEDCLRILNEHSDKNIIVFGSWYVTH